MLVRDFAVNKLIRGFSTKFDIRLFINVVAVFLAAVTIVGTISTTATSVGSRTANASTNPTADLSIATRA